MDDLRTLVREAIRKLSKDDLKVIASAETDELGLNSAAKDEAKRILADRVPTLCRLYTTDVMSPVKNEMVDIKEDRKNIGAAIGLGPSLWFERITLWMREKEEATIWVHRRRFPSSPRQS